MSDVIGNRNRHQAVHANSAVPPYLLMVATMALHANKYAAAHSATNITRPIVRPNRSAAASLKPKNVHLPFLSESQATVGNQVQGRW